MAKRRRRIPLATKVYSPLEWEKHRKKARRRLKTRSRNRS